MRASQPSRQKIALALSGGAARTIAHVGVLKILSEAGIVPAALAGTSGGALVAVLVAAGYPLTDLESSAHGLEWSRIAELRPNPLGLLSTERLGGFMRKRIGDLRFEDLRLPCAVVVADLTTQERRVITSGPVIPAVEASCAIPEFYRPVEIDGHLCVDGGVVEPLPIAALNELPAAASRVRVAVSVLRKPGRVKRATHIAGLIGQVTQIMQFSLAQHLFSQADLLVEPEVGPFPLLHLENAAGLIAAGETAMRDRLEALRRLLADVSP